MSSNSGHRISRSNQGIRFYDTVQTSWRPQLPLPKEIPAQLVHNSSAAMDVSSKNAKKDSPANKKWSFGRFFRKKKDLETDSSTDDDRKAGFVTPQKPRKKEKRKRSSQIVSPGFDHIVLSPLSNDSAELFLPFEAIDTTESIRSGSGSMDRRGRQGDRRQRSNRLQVHRNSSSDEDGKSHNSHNSSSLPQYRSDESIGSGGVVAGNRRSRAARTERYYKRMSRDDNPSIVAPQVGRWKTQPVQMNQYEYNNQPNPGYYLKNSTSMTSMPNGQQYIYAVPNKNHSMKAVSADKRSISYDNHIHMQNLYNKRDTSMRSIPPPPPPRDPLRRVNVPSQGDLRPISYAFDKSSTPVYAMNNRCVSDDKLWGPEGSIYQSSIQRPSSAQPMPQTRRFITRAERDAANNPPPVQDFKYVADAIPRSRKPIHIMKSSAEGQKLEPSPNSAFSPPPTVVRTTKSGLPSPMQSASNFWKQIDKQEVQRRGRPAEVPRATSTPEKPRSVSNTRASSGGFGVRSNTYENFKSLNGRMNKSVDEIDSVVSGNLYLKPTKDNNEQNFVEVSTKSFASKANSMPNYYQQQRISAQQQLQRQPLSKTVSTPPPNKYEEYIARKAAAQSSIKTAKVPPPPPQRKSIRISSEDLRKPTTNLEDAINELEAIYKSLKLGDEDLLDRAERRDIPTPTNFEKYAVVSDEDEEPDNGEPDVVLDDVAYRNIKRANTMIKTIDTQPPFGIPIGPVPPSPNTDYLHVNPDKDINKKNRCVPQNVPDLVADDLAVRSLRKDVPGLVKPSAVAFSRESTKKKRATRSVSANIYNIIQRDAAKPSGGDPYDFSDLDRALERAGSLSDVRHDADDVPSALQLLRNLRKDDKDTPRKSPPVFRHPSQGGAVFNLPSTLKTSPRSTPQIVQKPPIPLPRKSHSPAEMMMQDTSGMEEILDRIEKEAKESSEKLSRELLELRSEKLSQAEKPVVNSEISKLNETIEETSNAAKECGEALVNVLPQPEEIPGAIPQKRKLSKEEKLIQDIDSTSEAAKVCEKILKNVVTIEPPVTIETAEVVSQTHAEIEDFVDKKNAEPARASSSGRTSDMDLIDFSDDTDTPKQSTLAVSTLLEKLDPLQSEQIGIIAERCMRQISELNDLHADEVAGKRSANDDQGDYDNLNSEPETSHTLTCKQDADDIPDYDNIHGDHIVAVVSERKQSSEAMAPLATQDDDDEEDIDKIMKECEEQVMIKTPYTSLSSSDCPKSSSPASSRQKSSSITSIHAMSSSDYVKSSSSEFHTPSTDPIKTFSTTSYDVNSSSPTPNITNSPLSTTPSPLFAPTPINSIGEVEADDCLAKSQSQYNSSEELAMIFGTAPTATSSAPPPPEDCSTTTASSANPTATGKKTLALKLINSKPNAACVATANNHTSPCVVDASTTTRIFTSEIVVSTSTSPVPIPSTSRRSPTVGEEHASDDDTFDVVTLASPKTLESCRLIRLVSSPASATFFKSMCLDTIPELHDVDPDEDDVNDCDVDEDFSVDNPNTFVNFVSFTNTSDNSMQHDFDTDDTIEDEGRTSFSSNTDSGNVSLADFPIQELHQSDLQVDMSVNTSLELSLFQNSDLSYSEKYPFVSEVEIHTVSETVSRDDTNEVGSDNEVDLAEDNEEVESDREMSSSTLENSQSETPVQYTDETSSSAVAELRNRTLHSTVDQSPACGLSQLTSSCQSASNRKQSNFLANSHTRQSFVQHIVIACTYSVASHDFYTLAAIVFAVIVIILFIFL